MIPPCPTLKCQTTKPKCKARVIDSCCGTAHRPQRGPGIGAKRQLLAVLSVRARATNGAHILPQALCLKPPAKPAEHGFCLACNERGLGLAAGRDFDGRLQSLSSGAIGQQQVRQRGGHWSGSCAGPMASVSKLCVKERAVVLCIASVRLRHTQGLVVATQCGSRRCHHAIPAACPGIRLARSRSS